MKKRFIPLISSISNAFCDFCLDISVNNFDMYKVLFYTSTISLLFQIIYSLFIGIQITLISMPFILIYGIVILLGYICYIYSLKNIPIGLGAMLENSDLFIILIIDIIIGNIILSFKFVILFILFVFSIFWFTIETNKIKDNITIKKIKLIGIVFIFLSVLCYSIEPYIIKLAMNSGANEIAINLGYYVIAIPFFYRKSKKNEKKANKKIKKKMLYLLIFIGLFEAIYYIFGTIGYMYDTPIIVNIIQEIRVLLLIILSAIFKTDQLNLKKVCAMIICLISIFGICFL